MLVCVGGHCLAQSADTLGTLLFNATERQAITARRSGPPDQAPASAVMLLSGVVTRGGGKSTAWINGRPMQEGEQPMPGMPLVIGRGQVKINQQSLRIGETLDLTTQQRTDILPPQAVTRRQRR